MCSTGDCLNISTSPVIYPPVCSQFLEMASQHAQLLIKELQSTNGTLNDSLDRVDRKTSEHTSVKHTWFAVVIPIISFLGIVGNVFNLLVLTRRRMLSSMDRLEKSATYGLIALAVSDMIFCVTVFPHAFIYEESYIVDGSHHFFLYYKLYGIGLVNLFLMISTWLIVTMSINRYIVVVYPLHARSTLSTFRTVLIIILVYIISTILTLPFFLHHKIVQCIDLDRNVQVEYQSRFQPKVMRGVLFYMKWIWPILADFIPIGILAFCNTRLVWELKRATSTRKRTAHGQIVKESNHKVTLTLVIIVLMLLFLVSPSEILRYINPYKSWGDTGHVVASITNVLQAINFAFNFILYCVVSATFRHTLKSMFTRCYKEGADKAEMQSMLTHVNTSMDKTIITDTEIY